MRVVLSLAVLGVLGACAESEAELGARLRSQAAMPECTGTRIRLADNQSVGIQDYIVSYRVKGSRDCLQKWQRALRYHPAYQCSGASCTRFSPDADFDEEWATVAFEGSTTALVEFTKT